MATMGFIKSTELDAQEETASIMVPETFTHSIAFGQTGCGKTSSFIYPNLKNRLELGHGILFYDYKGKEHLSVKVLAEMAGRLEDVVEIGKPWGKKINLVQNMDEDELDKFFDVILKHGEDSKYWQNSAKSLGQSLLKVFKAIEGFANAYEAVDNSVIGEYLVAFGFEYPTKRTLKSLVESCVTFERLGKFIEKLDKLVSKAESMIQRSAEKTLKNEVDVKKIKLRYKELIGAKEKLKATLADTKKSLESFGKDSNENLTQNIMGSLIAPLLSLAQNEAFNTNDFDIVSALNEGKIVVVNVESLSNAVVESLNNTILYELSKRTKSMNINPISIFIDEVQRVLSKNADLPIDVFREAKVDLFLATQNSALLKEKLKEEKFDSLMGNLTQKYYFKSSSDEELESARELKLLEGFEYVCSDNDYSSVRGSTPIFLDDDQKLTVEYKYQKKLNVLVDYLYEHKSKPYVLEYDSRLYKDNKVIAIDVKTKKERILESLNLENALYLEKEVNKLFARVEETLNEDEEEYLAS